MTHEVTLARVYAKADWEKPTISFSLGSGDGPAGDMNRDGFCHPEERGIFG
ncbi:hypothetical protein [Spirosoma aerophilum]